MLKTYRITKAYEDNYRIEAFESGKNVLDIIVNDFNIDGAQLVLSAFGYKLTRRHY